MRTRRRFQPSFDSMPSRIAPSGTVVPASDDLTDPYTAGTLPSSTSSVGDDPSTSVGAIPSSAGSSMLVLPPYTAPPIASTTTTLAC